MLLIPIHETFQGTIQGEGYWSGIRVDFIRLAGCPIKCAWCDTGYANGGIGLPHTLRSFDELIQELQSPRVVISGGEPFIHQLLPQLVQTIIKTNRTVSIETSGAFWQPVPDETWLTLSPKQHLNPKYPVQPIFWTRANEIKLIISTGRELDFYHSWIRPDVPVFLQPEWNQRSHTLPLIFSLLSQYPNYRLSVQLHKYLGIP